MERKSTVMNKTASNASLGPPIRTKISQELSLLSKHDHKKSTAVGENAASY